MSSEKNAKINQVFNKWPFGMIGTLTWLKGFGVSQQLAYKYMTSHWIERLGYGVYKRVGDAVLWDGAIHALQYQLGLPLHVAGISALTLQGRGQHLLVGERVPLLIRGTRGIAIPRWLKKNDWKAEIKFDFKTALPINVEYMQEIKVNGSFPVRVASTELAILEYIESVKDQESFLSAKELMEGMVDLRVTILQQLLEKCTSIKTTRIFLYLAEWLHLPWFGKLDQSKINLGSGKRVIVRGGVLSPKYAITVPKILQMSEESIF